MKKLFLLTCLVSTMLLVGCTKTDSAPTTDHEPMVVDTEMPNIADISFDDSEELEEFTTEVDYSIFDND